MSDASPVEDAAAIDFVDVIDKNGEGSPPGQADEEIEWVVQESRSEGQKPQKAEKNRDGGDDYHVDFPTKRTNVVLMMEVKEVSVQAKNNLKKNLVSWQEVTSKDDIRHQRPIPRSGRKRIRIER
jgi:hypothetical protein